MTSPNITLIGAILDAKFPILYIGTKIWAILDGETIANIEV